MPRPGHRDGRRAARREPPLAAPGLARRRCRGRRARHRARPRPAGCWRRPRALAAHEPAIAAAVRAADTKTHEPLENLFAAGVAAGEWPPDTDPALSARLFTAGLYGLMAQWHLAPAPFSWAAAAAALAGGPPPAPKTAPTARASTSGRPANTGHDHARKPDSQRTRRPGAAVAKRTQV